ncbi:MAG: hypothetical protein CL916_15085 [Deltaproteobacteria bacterium]|nr:hypothetical protein [Deltaproteobacteria bacterium]
MQSCHERGFEVGVETNGTRQVPDGIDWICVSPKPRTSLVQTFGHELKLVYPQIEEEMSPSHFTQLDFMHFFIQPMATEKNNEYLQQTLEYCLQNPQWKLSLQTHKIVGVR